MGLSNIEYDSFHEPKKLIIFEDKVVTSITAGSTHSAALMIEGYAYTWGSNSKGQLAQGEQLTARLNSNLALPKLIENLLGRGLNKITCRYDSTYFCNSEKGYYTEV